MNLANNERLKSCCGVQEALHPVATQSDTPGEGVGIRDGFACTWL